MSGSDIQSSPRRKNKRVYLDWAATAPLCAESREATEPFLISGLDNLECGANANSLHSDGRRAFSYLEEARFSLARNLGAARPDEIIFTSGATEANNAALFGMVSASKKRAEQAGKKDFIPHIITTALEHDAVLAPAKVLRSYGCEVTYLRPDRQGFIDPQTLEQAMGDTTVLVSVQFANNEIGSIQEISHLASIAHDAGALFHSDAVQAPGKIPVDLCELGVDSASFSAHKMGGPKGVGALYLKIGTIFDPLIVGGGQELGKRSGTQNVGGAVGFAAACEAACRARDAEAKRLVELRDYLYSALDAIRGVHASVSVEAKTVRYLPHIVNVYVDGMESETMILRLDMQGIEVSGGSACASHSLEPSHVLRALGMAGKQALGSVRVSMGRSTDRDDIDTFIDAFKNCIR